MQNRPRRRREPSFDDFQRRLPGDEGDFLVVPEGNRRYFAGSPVPAVGMTFVERGGLFLPESAVRPPQPIDLMGTYLTFAEIFGRRPGLAYVVDALGRIGRDPFVRSCAELLGRYDALQANRSEIDEALVTASFREPTASRVRALLQGNRVLITPQALLLLMRFSLVISPDEPPEGAEPRAFIGVVLALQDELGYARSPGGTSSGYVFRGETTSPLFREIVANQAFAASVDEVTLIASHHLHWEQLPAEVGDRPGRVDLKALFEEATGISKDDFMAVGTALWVSAELNQRYPVPATIFDSFTPSREQIEAALSLFAATPEQLRDEIAGLEQRFQTQWSFDVLRRYPVMRMDDGSYLVLSKPLLLERHFGWLPIYDLTEGLQAQGRRREARQADTWYRTMCELDARQGLENLAMPSDAGRRLYFEEDIQEAFGTTTRNADAAIDYGDAWVVVEMGTHKLTRATIVAGEPEALAEDLRVGVEEKVEQIDATIQRLIEDESRLTSHPARPRRRYVAVLLLTEGFPTNPMTMTAVRERLAARGLLADPRIGPLHIVDQEEMNMVEAVAESGGPSLLTLLEEHERSTLRDMGLRDYLIVDRGRGVGPERAQRTEAPFERAWEPVIDRVRQTQADPAAEGRQGTEP